MKLKKTLLLLTSSLFLVSLSSFASIQTSSSSWKCPTATYVIQHHSWMDPAGNAWYYSGQYNPALQYQLKGATYAQQNTDQIICNYGPTQSHFGNSFGIYSPRNETLIPIRAGTSSWQGNAGSAGYYCNNTNAEYCRFSSQQTSQTKLAI
jgi:hypothetical protein